MNIFKGTNEPIVLEFENSIEAQKVSALLYSSYTEKVLKHWDIDDIEIDGLTVKLPLTEDETLDFASGSCTLEVKLLDDDKIVFFDTVEGKIINRKDDTVLIEV